MYVDGANSALVEILQKCTYTYVRRWIYSALVSELPFSCLKMRVYTSTLKEER